MELIKKGTVRDDKSDDSDRTDVGNTTVHNPVPTDGPFNILLCLTQDHFALSNARPFYFPVWKVPR